MLTCCKEKIPESPDIGQIPLPVKAACLKKRLAVLLSDPVGRAPSKKRGHRPGAVHMAEQAGEGEGTGDREKNRSRGTATTTLTTTWSDTGGTTWTSPPRGKEYKPPETETSPTGEYFVVRFIIVAL